jgi:hypothetical protein
MDAAIERMSYGIGAGAAAAITASPAEDRLATVAAKLSKAGRELLHQVAGHQYAWAYISRRRGRLKSADALVCRGILRYGEVPGRDHHDCPEVSATAEGLELIRHLWPSSPAALGSYRHDGRRWTDPAPEADRHG